MTRPLMRFHIDTEEYVIAATKNGMNFVRNTAAEQPAYKIIGLLDALPDSSGITNPFAHGQLIPTKGYIAADPAGKDADAVLCDFFIALIDSIEDARTIQSLAQSLDGSGFTKKAEILEIVFTGITNLQKKSFFLQGLSPANAQILQLTTAMPRQAAQAAASIAITHPDTQTASAENESLYERYSTNAKRPSLYAVPEDLLTMDERQPVILRHTIDLNAPVILPRLPFLTPTIVELSLRNISSNPALREQQFLTIARAMLKSFLGVKVNIQCDPREKKELLVAIALESVSRLTINTEEIDRADFETVFALQSAPPLLNHYRHNTPSASGNTQSQQASKPALSAYLKCTEIRGLEAPKICGGRPLAYSLILLEQLPLICSKMH